MNFRPISICGWIGVFAGLILLQGCGRTNQPVQADLARNTLVQTLEQWKSGMEISECQTSDPSVVVQDFDWLAGRKLKSYEIVKETPLDANLFVVVRLELTEAEPTAKTVQYCVGTDPVLTVFRTLETGEAGL